MVATVRRETVRTFYPIASFRFWRAYLITMRPYLLFVSGAAGMVGLAFIEKDMGWTKVVAFIPLFLSYGFGQALTDCFQTDTDAISSPYRPLVKGVISNRQVFGVSIAGLLLSVTILAYLNPWILLPGLFSVFGLLSYTYFKKRWWGGPPWNAWIVALLPIIGRYVDTEFTLANLARRDELPFLLSVTAIFFSYFNFVLMGYFKDISADEKTGYYTFPVVFGWKRAAYLSDAAASFAFLFTGSALVAIGEINAWSLIFFGVAASVSLYAQIGIHTIRVEQHTYRYIENCVRSFVLYCITIVVAFRIKWAIPAVLFYVLFEIVMKQRPEKSQV